MIYEIGIHYTGDTVYDQQVKIPNIPIDKDQRKFWFGSNMIPHWNEDDTNTWVKVPVLYNGLNKIYVNDSANKDLSNIDETMIFGDDFRNETTLDTSKWILFNRISVDHELKMYSLPTFSSALGIYNNTINIDPTKDSYNFVVKNFIRYAVSGYSEDWIPVITLMLDANNYFRFIFGLSTATTPNIVFAEDIATTTTVISTEFWSYNTNYTIKLSINKGIISSYILNNNTWNLYGTLNYTVSGNHNIYLMYKPDGTPSTSYANSNSLECFYMYKYLPADPIITYIKPYQRMFHIKNTIFSSEQQITKYNTNSYIETPVIELNGAQASTINPNNNSIIYYRSSNTQPDITPSGTTTDINNNTHNYWDQNTISNSGWNNTIPSDYITYTSDTILSNKYIQLKIPLTQQG